MDAEVEYFAHSSSSIDEIGVHCWYWWADDRSKKMKSRSNAVFVARATDEACSRDHAGKKLEQKSQNIGVHLGKRLKGVFRIWGLRQQTYTIYLPLIFLSLMTNWATIPVSKLTKWDKMSSWSSDL